MSETAQLLDAALNGDLDLDADASNIDTSADSEQADESKKDAQPGKDKGAPETETKDDGDKQTEVQDNEQPGLIASKSGKYGIPYEKLTEARQQRDEFKSERDAFKAKYETLLALMEGKQQAEPEKTQSPVDAAEAVNPKDLFADFTEEGIAKGVVLLAEQRAQAIVEAKLKEALTPLQQQQQVSAAQAHWNAIVSAHQDAEEVADSAEFKQWVDKQPGYAQGAIVQALQHGTADQVIEVLSAFKAQAELDAKQTQTKPADKPDAAVQSAVEKARSQAAAQPPVSLSEMPGAPAASDSERVAAIASDPVALMDFMAGLSPEKQMRLMNSVV
ncbi:MAG: hypothetical protein Q4F13_02745 [Pseudomonadota bacterium]|nr:hypothetical protein [Pseudomonadota bacterium]